MTAGGTKAINKGDGIERRTKTFAVKKRRTERGRVLLGRKGGCLVIISPENVISLALPAEPREKKRGGGYEGSDRISS